jgi:hypothetical protein
MAPLLFIKVMAISNIQLTIVFAWCPHYVKVGNTRDGCYVQRFVKTN